MPTAQENIDSGKAARAGKAFARTHVLCVRCGYDIDGAVRAVPAGSCPECALGCEASDPRGRVGTVLERVGQKRSGERESMLPDLRGLMAGVWAMVRMPRAELGRMRAVRSWPMRWVLIGLAAVVAGACAFVAERSMLPPDEGAYGWGLATAFVLMGCPVLTGMESVGMRVIGRTRGWRLTKRNAQAIADHACVGWVMGAVVGGVLAVGAALLMWHFQFGGSVSFDGRRAASTSTLFIDPASLCVLLSLLGVFVVGLLWFEWLCWLGMRARKFAADEA